MRISIPEFVKSGDTIGVTAPSFGCTIEPYSSRFEVAREKFLQQGISIKAGKTVFMSDGKGISSKPEICARELEEFYSDPETSCIISAGGGEMMCETAGLIDFDKIRGLKPKWYVGYSDNTNFIFPLVTKCRVAAVYGPCISGFGKFWEKSETDCFGILTGQVKAVRGYDKFQNPEDDSDSLENLSEARYALNEDKILRVYDSHGGSVAESEEVSFDGILLGGCLDVLANITGTNLDDMARFNSEAEKVVWVLESCDGNPMEIRRQVWHLKSCGWFEKASGFLIGRPLSSFRQEMMGVDQYNAVTDILSDLGVPIVLDCDIGHIDPAMPLVMGSCANVKVCGNSIEIGMKL